MLYIAPEKNRGSPRCCGIVVISIQCETLPMRVCWFEGSYTPDEGNCKAPPGHDIAIPHRVKYKPP